MPIHRGSEGKEHENVRMNVRRPRLALEVKQLLAYEVWVLGIASNTHV